MISKYLQIQLFYVALILIVPYAVSYLKPMDDKMKGHIAAGLSVMCALLWLIFGRNMVKIQ